MPVQRRPWVSVELHTCSSLCKKLLQLLAGSSAAVRAVSSASQWLSTAGALFPVSPKQRQDPSVGAGPCLVTVWFSKAQGSAGSHV